MALQKQNVTVNLEQGADTKTNPKGVIPGKLLRLENGVFTSPKSISKRNGYAKLSALDSGRAVSAYSSELIGFDATSMQSYEAASGDWISRGSLVSCAVTQAPIVRNTYQQTSQDGTVHSNGISVYAWEDTQGGSRYCVMDTETGLVLTNQQIVSTAVKPKVLTVGDLIVLFWVNTSDNRLYGATIPIGSPSTAITPVALTASSGTIALNATTPNYDATVSGTNLAIAYNDSSAAGVSLFVAPVTDPFAFSYPLTVIGEAGTALTVFHDAFGGGPVVAWWATADVKFKAYSSTLTVLGSGTLTTTTNVISITGASLSSSALSLRFFYGSSAVATYNYVTRTNTVSGAYLAGTSAALCRSVSLSGKAFVYEGTAFVPVGHTSTLQPTYFVLDEDGNVAAKLLAGLAGGYAARTANGGPMLPESVALSNGTSWVLPLLEKDLLSTDSGAVFTQTGVTKATIDFFDSKNSYLRQDVGGALHVSGGYLQMYDGVSPVEHGFHLYPENVSAAVTAPNTGSTKSYQYSVCYEWIDNLGQTHRSAPSVAFIQTTVNAVSNVSADTRITLTIPTYRVTAKQGSRSPVSLVVYRTEHNGTTFYQVTSTTSPTRNVTTSDTVSFVDTVTDAALVGNPLLYTTGGVVENVAPNATTSLVQHRSRLWALDSTNGQWRYSKQIIPGAPVEFSDVFALNVDPQGGLPTAGASIDDKFVIFKADRIFAMTGQGPDSTGSQNDFSDAVLVTSDCGCTNARSVVTVPEGLMFQSAKGLYLLDRSLGVKYIGADMEAYNSDTVTSAQLIASTNQVRFTLDSGVWLTFDYLMRQWSVFTPLSAVDSTLFQDKFTYIREDGTVFQETPGLFGDAGRFIKLRAVTSWLQFAGVQAYQRAYKALILGNYESAHSLLVQTAYDFNPNPAQTDRITPTVPGTYGSESPYGGTPDTVYGGDYPLYQWRIALAKQKCEAIQLSIEDEYSGTIGEGMSLFAITFEVGVKRGTFKMAATRTAGGA